MGDSARTPNRHCQPLQQRCRDRLTPGLDKMRIGATKEVSSLQGFCDVFAAWLESAGVAATVTPTAAPSALVPPGRYHGSDHRESIRWARVSCASKAAAWFSSR